MIYNVQNLTQTGDCDVLLSRAAKRKADLNHKLYSEESSSAKDGETAEEIQATLEVTIALIAAETIIINGLPEGKIKEDRIFEKKNQEHKKDVLEHRLESYGVVAMLEQEMDLGLLNQEIEEVDAFIAAVTARKVELAA